MTPQKTEKNGQSEIRKMGISLLVLGTVVIAMGAVALRQGRNIRDTLLLAFGTILFVAGIYTWRNTKN